MDPLKNTINELLKNITVLECLSLEAYKVYLPLVAYIFLKSSQYEEEKQIFLDESKINSNLNEKGIQFLQLS